MDELVLCSLLLFGTEYRFFLGLACILAMASAEWLIRKGMMKSGDLRIMIGT